jgi:ankyrin repeat protein
VINGNVVALAILIEEGKNYLFFWSPFFSNTTYCCLPAGCDVNAQDNDGNTPLMTLLKLNGKARTVGDNGARSVHHGLSTIDFEKFRFLLHCGARLNVADKSGALPLHVAARNSDERLLQFLLEERHRKSIDVNALDNDSKSALYIATEQWYDGRVSDTDIGTANFVSLLSVT